MKDLKMFKKLPSEDQKAVGTKLLDEMLAVGAITEKQYKELAYE